MTLDVETPEQPDLTNRGVPRGIEASDALGSERVLRREDLEELLHDGAWQEAFHEWAEYTDLTEAEFRTVRDHGLFERLDFYWDPVEERLRSEVPTPTEDVDWDDFPPNAENELADLAHTVVEMLEDGYADWIETESGSTSAVARSEEALGDETRED